jgi:hypothetical protein
MPWPMVMLLATLALLLTTTVMNVFPNYWGLPEVQPEERARDRRTVRHTAVLACAAVLGWLVVRRGERSWRTAASLLVLAAAAGGTVADLAEPGVQLAGIEVRRAQYLLGILALPAAIRLGPGLAVPDLTPKGVLTGYAAPDLTPKGVLADYAAQRL